ncbi:RDD family protein [Sediminicola luteus]|uniref:RDD domain-containing protein n=1 Tax=Sediminicola luteus TaxID=319238 RepID=A0A2A4GFD8_9FLAO|nr:RDD family protein [Sediminicola luteus]PCE66690.1 hypothetical protein B7P33_05205 [Sediminicola luteus]
MSNNTITYAGFWPRALALVIDSILIGIVSGGISYLNITQYKDFGLYLSLTLITGLYKPLLEKWFGATLGKMIIGLKVVDYEHKPISFDATFMRSVFHLAPMLFSIPYYYRAFQDQKLVAINDFFEFSIAFSQAFPVLGIVANLSLVITVVEVIVLMTDPDGRFRSLHDRLAKTYVIKTS